MHGGKMTEKKCFVHKSSYIDEDVEIGEGSKIWHFSHVQSGARIGKLCSIGQNVNIGNNVLVGNNVKIQNNVSIYEGIILEDFVFCGPSMVFTNILNPRSEFPQRGSKYYHKTLVQRGASLGANSTIVCGNTIGKYAFVGAGAVVTKDIPDYALVVGNPAHLAGWMCACGHKLDFKTDGANSSECSCQKCGRKYEKHEQLVKEIS
jgi:UDP-2-acetamido-3-amino-2,3-dideoxy-glucuronate N-acetyltransferase